jgi:nucleoside-diphosphate-sugar epimerase
VCAGSLELVEADLLTEGAFDAAFAGCSYVFHCASPFFIEAGDPQAELVDPAVRGTRNVMAAADSNAASVRRVVLTSSCAAVKGMGSPAAPVQGSTYSEADWNETSSLPGEAYWVSKVQAERAAWEAAKESGLDLVTILPGACWCAVHSCSVRCGVFEGVWGGHGSPTGCWQMGALPAALAAALFAAAHVQSSSVPA